MEAPLVGSAGAPAPALASPGPRAALPSAVAWASVSAEVEITKRPPAWIWTAPRATVEMDLARLMPTAAATLIPPAEVLALGVGSAPAVPLPLWAGEVVAAKARSRAPRRATPP